MHNLFGKQGLFRRLGTTVLLTTNSCTLLLPAYNKHHSSRRIGRYWSLADRLVHIEHGGITQEEISTDPPTQQSTDPNFDNSLAEPREIFSQMENVVSAKVRVIAEAHADLQRMTGDVSLYSMYRTPHTASLSHGSLRHAEYYLITAKWRNILLLMACTSSYSFFVTITHYWLQRWTESPNTDAAFYILGYIILAAMAWISTNGSMWSEWKHPRTVTVLTI